MSFIIEKYKIDKKHCNQDWQYWNIVATVFDGEKRMFVTRSIKMNADDVRIGLALDNMRKLADESGGRPCVIIQNGYHI